MGIRERKNNTAHRIWTNTAEKNCRKILRKTTHIVTELIVIPGLFFASELKRDGDRKTCFPLFRTRSKQYGTQWDSVDSRLILVMSMNWSEREGGALCFSHHSRRFFFVSFKCFVCFSTHTAVSNVRSRGVLSFMQWNPQTHLKEDRRTIPVCFLSAQNCWRWKLFKIWKLKNDFGVTWGKC